MAEQAEVQAGSTILFDNVAHSSTDPITSSMVAPRGNRSEGLTIWTFATVAGSYQIQIYIPDGTEVSAAPVNLAGGAGSSPPAFKSANWRDWGSAQSVTANTLHKFLEAGWFPGPVRVVFTPGSASAGRLYSAAGFYGGGA